ncbi:MAG: GNAT family N-acetyltransferase [Bacteroidota bacterium]
MFFTLLHSPKEIACELHESTLEDECIDELIELSLQLFDIPPNRAYFSRLHEMQSPHVLIARNMNGLIVGYKIGYALSKEVFYSWLGGIHPEYQHQGIASAMIIAQHAWCRQSNFTLIRTKTHIQNLSMYILNRNHGFHVVGFDESAIVGKRLLLSKNLFS